MDHSAIIEVQVFPAIVGHGRVDITVSQIKALSAYLGHSSTSVTLDMYVHKEFSQEDLDSVWEELREAPKG